MSQVETEASPAPVPGRRLGAFAVHPLLLAIYPALVLWAANVHEVDSRDVWPALWVPALIAVAAWITGAIILRSALRGALAASVLVMLGLYAGRVIPGLTMISIGAVAVAGAAGVGALSRKAGRDTLVAVTAMTNVLSLTLVAFAAPSIVSASWDRRNAEPPTGVDVTMTSSPTSPDTLPDIFYIIPDRYPREDTLRELFDYDNSAWIAKLEARGFQVADASLGNYPSTGMSLASTWNLAPIDQLVPEKPENPKDWGPAYALLKDHALGRNLVRAGYEYIHMGTWWAPTSVAASATQNLRLAGSSEFIDVFRNQIAPNTKPDEDRTAFDDLAWHEKAPLNTLFQWQELQRLASEQYEPRDQPRFVLAHITVPHEPYRFEADGSYVSPELARTRTREDNFLRQVQYVNNQIDAFLDELLSGPREDWPMVVIQSDEGPHPAAKRDATYNWLEHPVIEWQEKLQIFSAILLPANSDLVIPEDLRSVNTWRILLDEILGTNLGTLDVPVYIYSPEAIYDVVDVTDEVLGN